MSSFPTLATASEPPAAARKTILLDDFENLGGWSAIASPSARLEIAQDAGRTGQAMRLDFEFQDGAGWVIARKAFPMRLPGNFAFHFFMRGNAPPGDTEFKLVDSRENVWWFKQGEYAIPGDWQPITVKWRHISLA